jgi:hypothetical protein
MGRYKDEAAYTEHFKKDYYVQVGNDIRTEGLLSKPLNYMKLDPLGYGFQRS